MLSLVKTELIYIVIWYILLLYLDKVGLRRHFDLPPLNSIVEVNLSYMRETPWLYITYCEPQTEILLRIRVFVVWASNIHSVQQPCFPSPSQLKESLFGLNRIECQNTQHCSARTLLYFSTQIFDVKITERCGIYILLKVFLPNTDLLLWVELEIITGQITVANNHLALPALLTSWSQSVCIQNCYN